MIKKLIITLLILGFYSSAEAQLVRVSVRVLVAQPQRVDDWYPEVVMQQVKKRFREDLGLRLRVKFRNIYKVDHSLYENNIQIYSEFYDYLRKVKRTQKWSKLILVPAYSKDSYEYSAGLATWDLGLATIRQSTREGVSRYDQDWVVAAHELAHTWNAEHHNTTENIMNFYALSFARPDLRFNSETKREVRRFLKERRKDDI